MTEQQYKGIGFGFITIIIWLLLLTSYLVCAKMDVGERINKVIILPPPVENLEVIENLEHEVL